MNMISAPEIESYLDASAQRLSPYHSFLTHILTCILAPSLCARNCEIPVVTLFMSRLDLVLGSQCLSVLKFTVTYLDAF